MHSIWHLTIGYGVFLLLQARKTRGPLRQAEKADVSDLPDRFTHIRYFTQQASAVLSGPGLYGRVAMFDNRHFARYPALNTLLPRVVYGAPVPTAAHATSIHCTSFGLPHSESPQRPCKPRDPCERCGRPRLGSVDSASTVSTASSDATEIV